MKRETLRHPKTLDLAARLGVERPVVLGILTLLWDFTAEAAIQGDIGKWPNGAIARACDYMGDHDAFVRALVESKWLDEHPEHRLIVHHWPDHCERWVKSKLKTLKISFLACYGDASRDTSHDVSLDAGDDPPCDRTEPNRTIQIPDGRLGGRDEIEVTPEIWRDCLPTMLRIAEVLSPGRPLKDRDRELAAKAAIVAHEAFGAEWLNEILRDIDDRTQPPERPWGYFKNALAKSATRAGNDFHAALRLVKIPEKFLERPKVTT